MKGVETMPVKLLLVCFLLLVVVSVGFYQINTFMNFKAQKDFKESLAGLVQQMKILKSSGDQGAFTSVHLDIPASYTLILDLDNDTIRGDMGSENYTINLADARINLIAFRPEVGDPVHNGSVVFLGGNLYDLRVYFGNTVDIKNLMLVFV